MLLVNKKAFNKILFIKGLLLRRSGFAGLCQLEFDKKSPILGLIAPRVQQEEESFYPSSLHSICT
jgi:hypothetical protein